MTLLVREVMMIGVPVCRATETCGVVLHRLQMEKGAAVVVLDDDGSACGWMTRAQLEQTPPARLCGEVADEAIPSVAPDLPVEAARELMRANQVECLFLMHAWPGPARPSAVISLKAIEEHLAHL